MAMDGCVGKPEQLSAAPGIAEIISPCRGILLAVSGFPDMEAEVFGFATTLERVSSLPPFPNLA